MTSIDDDSGGPMMTRRYIVKVGNRYYVGTFPASGVWVWANGRYFAGRFKTAADARNHVRSSLSLTAKDIDHYRVVRLKLRAQP
jgi:hypothetical protein